MYRDLIACKILKKAIKIPSILHCIIKMKKNNAIFTELELCFNSAFRSKKIIDPFYQFWEELSAEDLENLKKPIKRVIFPDQNLVQLLRNLCQLLLLQDFFLFFFLREYKHNKHLWKIDLDKGSFRDRSSLALRIAFPSAEEICLVALENTL